MTKLTDHAKTILRAIADGKKVKGVLANLPYTTEQTLIAIANGFANNLQVMAETRSINGVEFAAPVENGPLTYQFYTGIEAQRVWSFIEAKDRDAAYKAIVDALEGKSK